MVRWCARPRRTLAILGTAVAAGALGCDARDVSAPALPDWVVSFETVALSTYDGSGQAVHPSVLDFGAAPFAGYRCWIAVTPYPDANSLLENPSVLASPDCRSWVVPAGATNPVVLAGTAPPGSAPPPWYTGLAGGNLSDPDLVRPPGSDSLRLYFRQNPFSAQGPKYDAVLEMSSADGVRWSAPREILSDPYADIVSPTFTTRDGRWDAWYVRGACGQDGTSVWHRSSGDGVSGWSAADSTAIVQPGYNIWHIKTGAVASKGELWMLYSAYPRGAGDCLPGDLFLARSRDGVTWTAYPTPVLRHGTTTSLERGIYRPAFLYGAATDSLWLWVSGVNASGRANVVRITTTFTRLRDHLQGMSP